MLLLFNFPQLKAMESFIGVTFTLMYCFVIIDIAEFFLMNQGLFTMFLINKTNNSLFGFGLPVSFPKSVASLYFSDCILTPISDKVEEIVFSKWLSGILSGIPDKTKLFLLPYCPKEFRLGFL